MADNLNAFKHWFDEAAVRRIGAALEGLDPDELSAALWPALQSLELKQRIAAIAEARRERLPSDVPLALEAVVAALGTPYPPTGEPFPSGIAGEPSDLGLSGSDAWPLAHLVELVGPQAPKASC